MQSEKCVFKTPMAFSPRVIGNTVRPSPSRVDLWREELGLAEEDGNSEYPSETESDLDYNDNVQPTDSTVNKTDTSNHDVAPASHQTCSLIEYRSLQRQLDERDTQRDELLFRVKTLTDKTKLYKHKLEKEETSKRQQIKILQKTYKTQLEDKQHLIQRLEGVLSEDQDAREDTQEDTQGDSPDLHKNRSTKILIAEIDRLHNEKADITEQLLTLQFVADSNRNQDSEEASNLRDAYDKLLEEKQQLQDALIKQWNTKAGADSDPVKAVCKLEIHNDYLTEKVDELESKHFTAKCEIEAAKQEKWQDQITITKLKQQNEDLLTRLDSVESYLSKQHKQGTSAELCLREQVDTLRTECQDLRRDNQDLVSRAATAEARPPQVITKTERVEVEVQSQACLDDLKSCRQALDSATVQSQRVEEESKSWQQRYHDVANKLEQSTHKVSKLQDIEVENSQLLTKVTTLTAKCLEAERSYDDRKLKADEFETQIIRYKTEVCNLKSQMADEVQTLLDAKQSEIDSLVMQHETRQVEAQGRLAEVCLQLRETWRLLTELRAEYEALRNICLDLPTRKQLVVHEIAHQVCRAIHEISESNQDLLRKYRKEMKLRKKYHNELVELRGNIRVFCRVRPRINEDGSGVAAESVVTFDPADDALITVAHKDRKHLFELDRVFDSCCTQDEVFGEVEALVTSSVDGYNVCIFAYGQTGSGKTYTMEGTKSNPGINQRALRSLFRETGERSHDWHFTITVSVLEIYNENVRDLLSNHPNAKLDVKMNPEGGLHVPGLVAYTVTAVEDINRIFAIGQENRVTASTNMNERSSRSHALLCVEIIGVNISTGVKTTGKLNLVDLAGSERVSKSGAEGTRLKEAQNINKSLATLGDVIHALRSKQSHIPYRNSRLTYLLQDSLGGDSKTLMIVQVAPVEKNAAETMATLNFAQRVRTIELGQASKKETTCTPGQQRKTALVKDL